MTEERFVDPADYSAEPTIEKKILVQRELSQAMVPGSRLTKVEIEKSTYDEKMSNIVER